MINAHEYNIQCETLIFLLTSYLFSFSRHSGPLPSQRAASGSLLYFASSPLKVEQAPDGVSPTPLSLLLLLLHSVLAPLTAGLVSGTPQQILHKQIGLMVCLCLKMFCFFLKFFRDLCKHDLQQQQSVLLDFVPPLRTAAVIYAGFTHYFKRQ